MQEGNDIKKEFTKCHDVMLGMNFTVPKRKVAREIRDESKEASLMRRSQD